MERQTQKVKVYRWVAVAMLVPVTAAVMLKIRVIPVVAAGSPQTILNAPTEDPLPPTVLQELAFIRKEIDATEEETLKVASRPLDPMAQIQTLGKLELYDKSLSVKRNEACSFCHMPETGYTGRSQILNLTTVAYPGSIGTVTSARKPMSYVYATLAPVLHYITTQHDFYGGNFWDMRATGSKLQSPSAEQAQGPPTNPLEMGLPDSACVAWRIFSGRYVDLFTKEWGPAIKLITWPSDAEKTCSTPAGKNGAAPHVDLSAEDRDRANTVYNEFGLSIAAYEGSPEVNAFSSKFDAYLAGNVQLSAQEKHGYELFNGVAKCNTCHLSGTANGANGGTPANVAPLFTDFTSSNLGLPRNDDIPFYYENKPDQYGYVPNPKGTSFVDLGVGGFLSGGSGSPVPDKEWMKLAPQFYGKVQVPTLRNVDQRPYPGFVKSYMHNGYLKSLKEVVHFYNTRDKQCASDDDPGVKKTCWPKPEVADNEDMTVGNLGLSDSDEDDIVAFMKTLTDGFVKATPLEAEPSTRAQRADQ